MTAYIISQVYSTIGGSTSIGLKANTLPIRMLRIEGSANTYNMLSTTTRYITSSFSGGTTLSPSPLRDGAPATTATAKLNATASGTAQGLTGQGIGALSSYSYQFGSDMILAPGNIVLFSGFVSGGYGFYTQSITYEELQLSFSY